MLVLVHRWHGRTDWPSLPAGSEISQAQPSHALAPSVLGTPVPHSSHLYRIEQKILLETNRLPSYYDFNSVHKCYIFPVE
jgi:hypothetical protein